MIESILVRRERILKALALTATLEARAILIEDLSVSGVNDAVPAAPDTDPGE